MVVRAPNTPAGPTASPGPPLAAATPAASRFGQRKLLWLSGGLGGSRGLSEGSSWRARVLPARGLGGAIDAFQLRHMVLWPRPSPRYGLGSQPVHELWRTIALASAEESRNMNDGAAAVHGSALVVGSSYRWCAAGSGGWARAPITGTAGAGLGCPGVRLFRVEYDDASMSSAALWVRRVLLRVRMVGAY